MLAEHASIKIDDEEARAREIPFWELRLRESCFFLVAATYLNEDDRNALMLTFRTHQLRE
jgi:hypothetical protein